MTAVTPTDRPKSVRNSCVIKVFGGVFMLSRCFLDCSAVVGVFVTGLSHISSFFSWTCAELCEAFTFLVENIYVQFEGIVYKQIVGIPMGTNSAPLIADLFLFCYERNFMSNIHKYKQYDLIDMLNDTSRYLHDIFTINNPKFEKHIPDKYPTGLQLNRANTSDINSKVIGNDDHTHRVLKCIVF